MSSKSRYIDFNIFCLDGQPVKVVDKIVLHRVLLIPITNFHYIGDIHIARFECITREESEKCNFSKHDLTLKIKVKVKL